MPARVEAADHRRELAARAVRQRVELRDPVTSTLNDLEALGNRTLGAYDSTAPEGRPWDQWNDRPLVLLGHVFGEKPKVRQIAAHMNVPSVEITRVAKATHEVRVDLGPTRDQARLTSAEERFAEVVPAVSWWKSLGVIGLRSTGDFERAENFLRKR